MKFMLSENMRSGDEIHLTWFNTKFGKHDFFSRTKSSVNQGTSIFTPVLKSDDNLFQVLTRSSEPKIYLSDDIRWYLTISDTFSTKKLLNRTNWSSKFKSCRKITNFLYYFWARIFTLFSLMGEKNHETT